MRKKSCLLIIVLACVMCVAMAVPSVLTEEETKNVSGKVMPSEIIAALTEQNSGMQNITDVQNSILASIALPTSLGIDIINIDMDKVHQTYPMTDDQIAQLKSHGYTDSEIAELDMGDYFNIEAAWLIDPSIYSAIKFLYPDLMNTDISNWTYADLKAYSTTEDAKKYAPTEDEALALAERNITLDDAKKLLKDYGDYETILAQSDEQLAEYLKGYYQFTIDNIYEMAKYEQK